MQIIPIYLHWKNFTTTNGNIWYQMFPDRWRHHKKYLHRSLLLKRVDDHSLHEGDANLKILLHTPLYNTNRKVRLIRSCFRFGSADMPKRIYNQDQDYEDTGRGDVRWMQAEILNGRECVYWLCYIESNWRCHFWKIGVCFRDMEKFIDVRDGG